MSLIHYTSSTAQGGGGSFKNRKPIGEIGCCESRMQSESTDGPKGAWGLSLSLSLSLFLGLSTYYASVSPGVRDLLTLVFGGGRGGGPGSGGAQRVRTRTRWSTRRCSSLAVSAAAAAAEAAAAQPDTRWGHFTKAFQDWKMLNGRKALVFGHVSLGYI